MKGPTPGAILEALRSAVTIIGPGEILAVRVAPGLSDREWDELKERTQFIEAEYDVRVLLLEGEGFARITREVTS